MHALTTTKMSTVVVMAACVALAGCMPKNDSESVPAPFSDDFSRVDLGPRYKKSGGTWTIKDGALHSSGEKNIPLWLDVPLSKNVRVEFTTVSRSPAVDTKVEIFGDGLRHESGYIVILAGWNNTLSTIARLDEHEKTRVEKRTKFEKDKLYKWTIERTNGRDLTFKIDGEEIVTHKDSDPLFGPRNNKLAFTNWQSDVSYDDLVITPLPD